MTNRRLTHTNNTSDGTGGDSPNPLDAAALSRAQEDTDALLRAAGDAINRALSRDPAQFLEQARQHGGE
jgi:hypothetical protein